MADTLKVEAILGEPVRGTDGPTVTVKEGGSISAKGTVIITDGDPSKFLLYLLVYEGTPWTRDCAPRFGQDEANVATPIQPKASGEWVCKAITGTVPSEEGAENQLVIWKYDLTTATLDFFDLQNFKAIAPPEARGADSQTIDPERLVTISHPSGVGSDEPYPVSNSPGLTTGAIDTNGTATGPANTTIYLRVFPGVPYPTMLPVQPVPGCVTSTTNLNGEWAAIVGGASCSVSTPFPVNQLLVWSWDASSSTYSSKAVIFHGKSKY